MRLGGQKQLTSESYKVLVKIHVQFFVFLNYGRFRLASHPSVGTTLGQVGTHQILSR